MRDTIAAIATPPGQGGVGIVRVSGPLALPILRRVCPRWPDVAEHHRLILTRARSPLPDAAPLDQVLAVYMPAPRSYTGEDVVELQGHGGHLNLRRLLEAVCDAGARPARPGEFTERAFLNGRMDLTQAEAVADIIHATHQAALDLALSHLDGQLGRTIAALQRELVVAVTLTEAAIDFSTEEHVYQLDAEALVARLNGVLGQIDRLLGTFDAGRQLREGVRVVILGRPNAGKSTLFNRLCGAERAIVTDIPGTTRDYLEEAVLIRDVLIRLVDTAGVRATDDRVEQLGVARALALADKADVVLWLIDGTDPEAISVDALAPVAGRGADLLPVITKNDLGCTFDAAGLDLIAQTAGRPPLRANLLDAEAAEALLDALAATARRRLTPDTEGAILTRQRHRAALGRAREALIEARRSAEAGMSHEFVALDLRLALEATGEVVGRVTTDAILASIFSEFCVGK